MKIHLIIPMFFLISIFSCSKSNDALTGDSSPITPIDTTISAIRYTGTFQKGPWGTVSGTAKLIITNGKWQLRVDDFNSTSGPDLYVYISEELQPLNFIRVGKLKGLSGSQLYDIPGNPDFMKYSYVLIYCEKFNHLFGSAALMKI